MILPVRKVQCCTDQCTPGFQIDLLETSLDEFAAGGDDSHQLALIGAVTGHSQIDLFLCQLQQALLIATDCLIQALVLGQIFFEVLGMFATQGFALCLQLVEFGATCCDAGGLARAGKQRQIERELHADHVAKLAAPTLVIELPAPVGRFFSFSFAYPGSSFAGHRSKCIQLRMLLQPVSIAQRGDRPLWQPASQRFVGSRADPATQCSSGVGILLRQDVFLLRQLDGFLLGTDRIGGLRAAAGNQRAKGVSEQTVFAVEALKQRLLVLNGVSTDPRRGDAASVTGEWR